MIWLQVIRKITANFLKNSSCTYLLVYVYLYTYVRVYVSTIACLIKLRKSFIKSSERHFPHNLLKFEISYIFKSTNQAF